MAAPTIGARLARKLVLFSGDAATHAALADILPPGWTITRAKAIADIGAFQDVLLHRFVLLDLDPGGAYDPAAIVREIRSGMMLNVPILCFGGDAAARDAARMARADRFFERAEIDTALPELCEQFGW